MDKFVTKRKNDGDDSDASSSSAKKLPQQKREDEMALLQIPHKTLADEKAIEAHFAQLAETLINDSILWANGVAHRIAELEFYYNTPALRDPFPHGDELQRTAGQWYFHRTGGTYRSGTYKGLDITIGSDEHNYGGILLRSLEVLDGGEFFCGPCVSVDHLLNVCKVDSIKTLVDDKLKGDVTVSPQPGKMLYLEIHPGKRPVKKPLMKSARVGLHMNKAKIDPALQKRYVFKPYRFFISHKKLTKGRMLAILQLAAEGKSAGDIHAVVGGTLDTLNRILRGFEQGRSKGNGDAYVGSKFTDDDIPAAFGALWIELYGK